LERGLAIASADFRRDLVSFVLIGQSLGARIVLVELAHVTGDVPASQVAASERAVWQRAFPSPAELMLEGYRRFSAVQRSVADSLGAAFVAARGFGITGAANYCRGDPIHFNAAGAELMGQKLAEALSANDMINSGRRN
jgi:hypothetical protein